MERPPSYSYHDSFSDEEQPPPFERGRSAPLYDVVNSGIPAAFILDGDLDAAQHAALGLHPPEDLPDYEPGTLPEYEDDRLQAPAVCYSITQISRNMQNMRPVNELSTRRPWYTISYRTSPSIFSKKADMRMLRLTGTGRRDSGVAVEQGEDEVANMSFDKSGALPWMPRALVTVPRRSSSAAASRTYKLSAPNFADWKFALADSRTLSWILMPNPWSIVLLDRAAVREQIVAQFVYGRRGTAAQKGEEVGRIEIYSGRAADDEEMMELVLATCQIAVQHWKSMGRHYKNGEQAELRRASVQETTRRGSEMRRYTISAA